MNRFELVLYSFILITITFYKYGQAEEDDLVDTFTLVKVQLSDNDKNTLEVAEPATIQELEGTEEYHYKYRLIIDKNRSYIQFHQNKVNSIYFYGKWLKMEVILPENYFDIFAVFDTELAAQEFCTGFFRGVFDLSFDKQKYGMEFTIKELRLFANDRNNVDRLVFKNPYITEEHISLEDNGNEYFDKKYAFQGEITVGNEELGLVFLVTPVKNLYLTDVIDDSKVVLYLSEKQDWKYVFYFDEPEHAQAFVNTIKEDVLENNYLDVTKIPQSLRTLIAD